MIDRNTIDRIFAAANIVEVIGEFVNLKRSGQNYRGLSPFKNEKTPSFFVSPAKGIFKCFSTGIGGNVVNFLMEHEKITYPDALHFLARKYNIEIILNHIIFHDYTIILFSGIMVFLLTVVVFNVIRGFTTFALSVSV